MKLGNLFRAVVKTATLPISVAADVVTLGTKRIHDGSTFTADKVDDIAEDLNEIFE